MECTRVCDVYTQIVCQFYFHNLLRSKTKYTAVFYFKIIIHLSKPSTIRRVTDVHTHTYTHTLTEAHM